jgi:hypothetical protein
LNPETVDWKAVNAYYWSQYKEAKQAEFLLEEQFPWSLVEAIGVYSFFFLIQLVVVLI